MNNLDLSVLTQREREVLEKWMEAGLPPLAVSRAMQFFELFCEGMTCEQIHKLNPQYELGAIIHARLRDKWDDRLQEYIAQMYGSIRDRVFKKQMEAISFTADVLSAAHKLHGEKIKRYLQTGDEKELAGAIRIDTLKQYKDAAELLMRLTGQDRQKEPALPPATAPKTQSPVRPSSDVIDVKVLPSQGMTSAQAGFLIRKQLEKRKEESGAK